MSGLITITSDFTYKIWYNPQDPLLALYYDFEDKFGNDDSVILAMSHPKSLLNNESLDIIQRITEDLNNIKGIVRVDSLTNFGFITSTEDEISIESFDNSLTAEHLNQLIKQEPMLINNLISQDMTITAFKAQLTSSLDKAPDYEYIVGESRKVLAKYQDEVHEFYLGGSAVLTQAFKEMTFRDMELLIPLAYLIFGVLLYYIYRNIYGILLPFILIATSITLMMGIYGLLGKQISTISAASPNILLTVAIADAVHILTVYFLSLKFGNSHLQAIRYSLTKNFYPTLLTSITTFFGFFSFVQAKIIPIADMGLAVGIGVLVTWLGTYFILAPLIILLLGRKTKNESHGEQEITTAIKPTQAIYNRIKWLERNAKIIISVTLVTVFMTLYFSSKLIINMDPFEQFPRGHEIVKMIDVMENKMDAITTVEIMVNSGMHDGIKDPEFLQKVDEYTNWLLAQPYIYKVVSVLDIFKKLNQVFHNSENQHYVIPQTKNMAAELLLFYELGLPPGREINNLVSIHYDSLRLTGFWNVHNSQEANIFIKDINDKARELGLNSVVTGKMPLFHELTPYVVETFLISICIALFAITITLVLVLKSFKLGLLALIPNVFPLFVGAALYQILGFDVDMGTVIIASVCLGVAVDDSIHFLFEYKKLKDMGKNITDNLALIFTNTFPSLFFTTILLAIGFGSFTLADYIPNAKFGGAVAVILVFALLADFLILPAILILTDKTKKQS
jgi:predicted RND superfamily exporter protein